MKRGIEVDDGKRDSEGVAELSNAMLKNLW